MTWNVVDTSLWPWNQIAEAAFARACLTDSRAAKKLRPAFRAVIEAALRAAPLSGNAGEKEAIKGAIEKHVGVSRDLTEGEDVLSQPKT